MVDRDGPRAQRRRPDEKVAARDRGVAERHRRRQGRRPGDPASRRGHRDLLQPHPLAREPLRGADVPGPRVLASGVDQAGSMMRAAMFVVWALLAVAVVWPLLRARRLPTPGRARALPDELVKDPVCQTYVVRSRAIRRA